MLSINNQSLLVFFGGLVWLCLSLASWPYPYLSDTID